MQLRFTLQRTYKLVATFCLKNKWCTQIKYRVSYKPVTSLWCELYSLHLELMNGRRQHSHKIFIDLCLTLSICSKVVVETMVAGASSMIFWWRRWMEQSLPNREIALPYWSARICTSRWRACTASCMMKIGEPGTSACTCIEEQTHRDTV